MTKKTDTVIPEIERLQRLVEDRDGSAADVDRLEEELSEARGQVREARDMIEADTMLARVQALESELEKAEQRAAIAAEIVQRDAGGLQEIVLRELRADLVKRYGPKAAELDRAVVDNVTELFRLFARRRQLEALAGSAILEIPSVGMTSVNPQNCGIMTRSTAIAHFSMALQGVEKHFAPIE